MANLQRTNLYLNSDMIKLLKDISEKEGDSVSEICREAIKQYIEHKRNKEESPLKAIQLGELFYQRELDNITEVVAKKGGTLKEYIEIAVIDRLLKDMEELNIPRRTM